MKDIKNLTGKALEDFKSEFQIESQWAPTVFQSSVDNQKYAIAIGQQWIPIPDAMTGEEVHSKWKKKNPNSFNQVKINKKVLGRGKNEYNVTFDGTWRCTCSGFSFRRSCSHIVKVKSELKSKFK